MVSKKIFVGSLSWNVDSDKLREVFSPFGNIEEAKVITDRETGRSRGFGFVTFENEEDAEKAIQEMNGKEVMGRAIRVNKAFKRRRNF